jgi:hypothetical protein
MPRSFRNSTKGVGSLRSPLYVRPPTVALCVFQSNGIAICPGHDSKAGPLQSQAQSTGTAEQQTHHRAPQEGLGSIETACSSHGASRTRTGDLLGAIGPGSVWPGPPRPVQVTPVLSGWLRFAQFGITIGSTGRWPSGQLVYSLWAGTQLRHPRRSIQRSRSRLARWLRK